MLAPFVLLPCFPLTFSLQSRILLRTCSVNMEIPSVFHMISLRDRLVPNFQQLSICLAFFAVIVLVIGLSFTPIPGSKHYQIPRSLRTFARFFYASFLKPHNGDGAVTGQQAALESFYKAQVVPLTANSSHT